jgi:hypothetical protein
MPEKRDFQHHQKKKGFGAGGMSRMASSTKAKHHFFN